MPVTGAAQAAEPRRLTSCDALWALRAAWRLVAARVGLAWRPGRALRHPAATARRQRVSGPSATQLARAVERAARRLPFRTTCLHRALALERLLHSHGLEASLRIGVCRIGDTLDAHAWIEHQNRPLTTAPPAGRYALLPTIDRPMLRAASRAAGMR